MTRKTRRCYTLTALLCALIGLGAVGCGKRDRVPSAIDGAVKVKFDTRPAPPIKLDARVWRDMGYAQPDLFVPPPPDQGPPGPPNSGAVCVQGAACANSGETCLVLQPNATKGLCLGMCDVGGSDCPVANSSTQLSKCIIQDNNKQLYCAWLCEVQGKSYQCPNNTDYVCVALVPQQPSIKFCMPK